MIKAMQRTTLQKMRRNFLLDEACIFWLSLYSMIRFMKTISATKTRSSRNPVPSFKRDEPIEENLLNEEKMKQAMAATKMACSMTWKANSRIIFLFTADSMQKEWRLAVSAMILGSDLERGGGVSKCWSGRAAVVSSQCRECGGLGGFDFGSLWMGKWVVEDWF